MLKPAGSKLWHQLPDPLWCQFRSQLADPLWYQLWDQLWDRLQYQLCGQLDDQLTNDIVDIFQTTITAREGDDRKWQKSKA